MAPDLLLRGRRWGAALGGCVAGEQHVALLHNLDQSVALPQTGTKLPRVVIDVQGPRHVAPMARQPPPHLSQQVANPGTPERDHESLAARAVRGWLAADDNPRHPPRDSSSRAPEPAL